MWWTILIVIIIGVASYFIGTESSNTVRGLLGGVIAVLFLLGFQSFLVKGASGASNKKIKLFDLIITSEDNCYSLSRFQIYIWTVWIVIAFVQVAFATRSFPSVPANVAVLLGVNGFTTVLSTAITGPNNQTSLQTVDSNFFKDIFLDKNGTLDLPRTQMFIWTLVILVIHINTFYNDYFTPNPHISNVDTGLLLLMGVSNGAYLGVKAASQKNSTP